MDKSAPERLRGLREMDQLSVVDRLLGDECDVVRHEAAFVLGDTHAECVGTIEALKRAAKDKSILVRHEVALALAKCPGESAIDCLASLCGDSAGEVARSARFALMEMLAPIGDKGLSPELLKQLRQYVREQAALADKSYTEWQKGYPDCAQATYRSGMWYAYHDVERFLGAGT